MELANSSFSNLMTSNLNVVKNLNNADIGKKLKCDFLYEHVNLSLSQDIDKARQYIGTGFTLAEQLNAAERTLGISTRNVNICSIRKINCSIWL